MRYFTLESIGKVPCKQETSEPPNLRQGIVVDEGEVLNLTVETGDESKLGFCATVCLFSMIVSIITSKPPTSSSNGTTPRLPGSHT